MSRFYRAAHMRLNIPPQVKRSYYDFAEMHLEGCKTFMDNEILKCAIFPCFDSPIAFLCQGPTFRKLKERYQSNYRGLEEDDDSEHEAERSTNVFDPRHQEINS